MADRKLKTSQKKNDYALNSIALALALVIIYLVSVSMSNETPNATARDRQTHSLGAATKHDARNTPGLSSGSLKQAAKSSPAS